MDKAKGRMKEAAGALTGNKTRRPKAAPISAAAP
jgi:uncharacterized protein YjbJ (UPF0337 family)